MTPQEQAMRESIEALVKALEIALSPHVLFEVHAHFEYTHWLWETDSTFSQQGWFPWTTDSDVRDLLLEEYRADLERLLGGRLNDGLAYGRIPVTFGKFDEDPPWEPAFSRAVLIPLDGTENAALADARKLLEGT